MSKSSAWSWCSEEDDHPIHHVEDEYAWAYEPGEDEDDESYAAEDYYSSRPWTDE